MPSSWAARLRARAHSCKAGSGFRAGTGQVGFESFDGARCRFPGVLPRGQSAEATPDTRLNVKSEQTHTFPDAHATPGRTRDSGRRLGMGQRTRRAFLHGLRLAPPGSSGVLPDRNVELDVFRSPRFVVLDPDLRVRLFPVKRHHAPRRHIVRRRRGRRAGLARHGSLGCLVCHAICCVVGSLVAPLGQRNRPAFGCWRPPRRGDAHLVGAGVGAVGVDRGDDARRGAGPEFADPVSGRRPIRPAARRRAASRLDRHAEPARVSRRRTVARLRRHRSGVRRRPLSRVRAQKPGGPCRARPGRARRLPSSVPDPRVRGALHAADGTPLPIGGKTGTGDNRIHFRSTTGTGSIAINRTSTFVFFAGDRFFGTVVAYVPGRQAEQYSFTSSLPASVLTLIGPELSRL